jgi:hypothetical protein
LAGYEDLNDAERLAADPTFRLIRSQRIWDRGAALTSTLRWSETELLTKEENLIGLMALNRETLGQPECLDSSLGVVLDMDSSEGPVHGEQEGSAYNGHFEWGASDAQKTSRRYPAVSMGPALVTSSWSRRQDRCTMRQRVSQIGNPV